MSVFPIFVLLTATFYVRAGEDDLVVKLWNREGRIRGHILKSDNGNDYYAFQEIPFAQPPIGKNRFKLPKEPKDWNDILNTTKNTKICYQITSKYTNLEISEDCLYLNVYTPMKPGSNTTLPVLFWIHGGGFSAESSTYEYYGPKYVMDHDVVVVTTNYRLGPFGFLTTEDEVIPANLGMRDQQFALQWTNRNIHLFGGDPAQVTIVGESAGSLAVGLLLMGPWMGKQLFHGAIMQSGSPVGGIVQRDARENAFHLGHILDENFVSESSTDLLSLLQNTPAAEILNANLSYGPVLEKTEDFSYPALQSFMDGNFKKLPVLIGFNSEEMIFSGYGNVSANTASFDNNVSLLIGEYLNMSPENRSIAGALLHHVYTNTSFQEDIGAYVRFSSDNSFTTPTLKQVELGSLHTPYYLYQFSYKGKLGGQYLNEYIPNAERVGHAEDLHYMWDDGSNTDLSKFSEDDRITLHRYVKLWTNFVKYFDPTPSHDPLLNIKWPKVENGQLHYLNINTTLEVRSSPRQYNRVKEILDEYIQPPYVSY